MPFLSRGPDTSVQEQDDGEATLCGSGAAALLVCVWRVHVEQAALPKGIPDVPLNGDSDCAAASFSSSGIGKRPDIMTISSSEPKITESESRIPGINIPCMMFTYKAAWSKQRKG